LDDFSVFEVLSLECDLGLVDLLHQDRVAIFKQALSDHRVHVGCFDESAAIPTLVALALAKLVRILAESDMLTACD